MISADVQRLVGGEVRWYQRAMQNLLVLNGAHEPDGLTNALTDAYVAEASQVANVVRLDLRELHFDYLLRRAHLQQPQEPDLIRASQAILAAKHVTTHSRDEAEYASVAPAQQA
jgi:hypothetical protein